jgi:alpha-tubulin suppressor-like RCC1 family protein
MKLTLRNFALVSLLMSFGANIHLRAQSTSSGVTKAYAGYTHSLFIRADGGLWATGDNQYRQLGDGTTTDRSTPIFVAGRVVAAVAGQTRTFYITDDGALYAVGRNLQGALGNGTATGNNANPQLVSNDVVSVSNKADHTLFIKSDGSLWAVGNNSNGQLGTGSTTDRYLPVKIAGDVIEARAGDGHTLFITADRKLWGMGANRYGQLGLGASQLDVLSPVVIATGVSTAAAGGWNQASEYHSVFAKTDGSVLAMGKNNNGQLGSGGKTDRLTPTVVSDRALQVDASQSVSLIVKNDGSLWGMGSNGFGQLGVQPNLDQTAPVRITPTDVVWASSGLYHTLFIKTGGALWGMGEDGSGRLGIPSITGRVESPLLLVSGSVPSPTAPTSVVASDGGSLSHVRVNWKPVLGATCYEIWRSTSTVFESGSLIGSRIEPGLFFDTTATAGTNYSYWIRAVNPGGTGSYSAADQGSVGAVPAFVQSPVDRTINVGASTSFTVSATGNPVPSYQWQISTNAGSSWTNLANDSTYSGATTATLTLTSVSAVQSNARYRCVATNPYAPSATSASASLTVNLPPSITQSPQSQMMVIGGTAIFNSAASGSGTFSYQWRFNGVDIPGATSTSFIQGNVQPAHAGAYAVSVSNQAGNTVSQSAILGVSSTVKVVGGAYEFAANILHPSGNVYDQILLTGNAATVTADPGQVVRISYIDLTDDIVQLEFSGKGTLTVSLEDASGPTRPAIYNQDIQYMKGHATVTLAGADEDTHFGAYSVGVLRNTNPALYKSGVNYDGVVDLALINVSSPTNRFGGLRIANVELFAAKGLTGINAPGVRLAGPLNVHNVSAGGTASPVLQSGTIDSGDIKITGGNLLQLNGRPIDFGQGQKVLMVDGTDSHNRLQPRQTNRGVLTRNGKDVTGEVVVNP